MFFKTTEANFSIHYPQRVTGIWRGSGKKVISEQSGDLLENNCGKQILPYNINKIYTYIGAKTKKNKNKTSEGSNKKNTF